MQKQDETKEQQDKACIEEFSRQIKQEVSKLTFKNKTTFSMTVSEMLKDSDIDKQNTLAMLYDIFREEAKSVKTMFRKIGMLFKSHEGLAREKHPLLLDSFNTVGEVKDHLSHLDAHGVMGRFSDQARVQTPFALVFASTNVMRSKNSTAYYLFAWGAIFAVNEFIIRPRFNDQIVEEMKTLCQGKSLQEWRSHLKMIELLCETVKDSHNALIKDKGLRILASPRSSDENSPTLSRRMSTP